MSCYSAIRVFREVTGLHVQQLMGTRALMVAAENGYIRTVRALCRLGVNINFMVAFGHDSFRNK